MVRGHFEVNILRKTNIDLNIIDFEINMLIMGFKSVFLPKIHQFNLICRYVNLFYHISDQNRINKPVYQHFKYFIP